MTLRVTSNIFTIHRKIIKLEIRYRNLLCCTVIGEVSGENNGKQAKGENFLIKKQKNTKTKIEQEFFPFTALNAYTEKYVW